MKNEDSYKRTKKLNSKKEPINFIMQQKKAEKIGAKSCFFFCKVFGKNVFPCFLIWTRDRNDAIKFNSSMSFLQLYKVPSFQPVFSFHASISKCPHKRRQSR